VLSIEETKDCGYLIIIAPILTLGALYEAVNGVLKELRDEGKTAGKCVACKDFYSKQVN